MHALCCAVLSRRCLQFGGGQASSASPAGVFLNFHLWCTAGLIGNMLSITMLVACEVAVEYWMALTWSPQVTLDPAQQHSSAWHSTAQLDAMHARGPWMYDFRAKTWNALQPFLAAMHCRCCRLNGCENQTRRGSCR